jgi:hypothetical protein
VSDLIESNAARAVMEKFYREHLPDRSLGADIFCHKIGGVVVDEPDFFLLARGVNSRAPWAWITCPGVFFPRNAQDCWFIWARAGSFERVLTVAPYYLPLVAWSRRNKPFRIYRTHDALRLIALKHKLRSTDETEPSLTTP